MLACTEMITMCLQSAKREHIRSKLQQQQQNLQNGVHGLSIFHDIFRRADKNDDGKLSFEEFKAYFADGILTTEELQELFYSIDGRQTNNLDTDKLSDYFSQHLGEYMNVLSALEKLNIAILNAMDKTKEEYQGSSVLGQFVTRFMLRETSSQLLSLQMSLQCAMEAVEEQSNPARNEVKAVPELLSVQKSSRRCGRRVQKNLCLSPTDPYSGILTTGVTVDTDDHWCSQINRLQQLIDKLECQSPKLEPLKEDPLASTYKSNILLVQRQMTVVEGDLEEFQKALRSYADTTTNQNDNLHVSIQKLPEKSCYIMYEFWQDRISWMSYLQSEPSKTFQRCVIDMLEDPELVSTMLLPASWWIMTNN
ncbi:N-terminal EF-hand calcium-binding protein 1 [Denticeps clupeoides]|uniref:N-terminal EF-hand calcium binding protein 3 n=1 Tax=Denticeps clupeoides TaxID=299321 RepID=A0AAY4EV42_9TELE|nr:N-terminal EF-hand calcium-binding protein 1-like [Denticeps clupeoides]XP_028853313.1 N-terminal EF-hand calcium-binding protein 1-like [Denticeps clupeoides]